MFKVTTLNLAPDTRSALPAPDPTDLGELSADEFGALLARFRDLDSVQNLETDPHLVVTARAGKFIVRTSRGKLLLYDARDITAPYAELTVAEILAHLDRAPAAPVAADTLGDASAKAASAPHRGIAFAILVAGLVLNGYTLYSVFYTETVSEKPAVTLLVDPAEIAARQHDALGTFATGSQPGDRIIEVKPDGVRFFALGSRGNLADNSDTYRLGHHGKNLCLATAESGVIDLTGIDTLVYYRDAYRRTK